MVTTDVNGETPDLYDQAGGDAGLRAMVHVFYASVLTDPLLEPLFGVGQPTHVDHLTAFFAEVFGGPTRYTDSLGGFPALLAAHRGLTISEAQRVRFVELLLAAAEQRGMFTDATFRDAFVGYAQFGTEVARQNSWATSDADLHECQVVPRWPG